VKSIRSIIRKALHEEQGIDGFRSVYPTSDKGNFPYEGGHQQFLPQEMDSLADYIKDWKTLSDNNEVYEFPTTEFNLGLQVERQRNPDIAILDVADKVIFNLKDDPQFYSKLRDRNLYGSTGAK